MIIINAKFSKILVVGIVALGILTGPILNILDLGKEVSAETIIIQEQKTPDSIVKKPINQYNKAVGWSLNNKLLYFTGANKELKEGKVQSTILLEERYESGKVFKTHNITLNIDKYNDKLISDYYTYETNFMENVEYMIVVSPDKEKVLISTEVMVDKPIDKNQYRIFNKGYSVIYDLKTQETELIDDVGRFVRWSSDSNYVFGINYAACYYKYVEAPYNQYFFPTYTYRNVSYTIADKKVDVVNEDKKLFDSLKVSKDIYEDVLINESIKGSKRFVLGYTDSKEENGGEFSVEKILFNNNPYNLDFIVDINKKNQYVFVGNDNLDTKNCGLPAIYVGHKGNKMKEKVLETFINNKNKIIIDDSSVLYMGKAVYPISNTSMKGINLYDIKSSRNYVLYEGEVGSFAFSPKTKEIALYDLVKKEILIGKLANNRIVNLKTFYKANMRTFEMYFNEDGTRLYFEGSYKDFDGVINIENGEIKELEN